MARLIKRDNLAIFEYPKGAKNPSFTLEEDGTLFITGYSISPFGNNGQNVGCAKRYETGLKKYVVIGGYEYAKSVIEGDIETLIQDENVDINNCVICIRGDEKNFSPL